MTDEMMTRRDIAETEPFTTAALLDGTREDTPKDAPKTYGMDGKGAVLLPAEESENLRQRWSSIQGSFVDAPREAVQHADELVATTIHRLAEVFAGERAKLEANWTKGNEVSTEDLRQALRRYRSFFDRLLSV
jgi:hypothetical protein